MTGYQETVTDPSYAEQLVCFTAPMVGNYGVDDARLESEAPHARAVVMRAAGGEAWALWLAERGVVALDEVDTRALTLRLRDDGAMRAVAVADERRSPSTTPSSACRRSRRWQGAALVAQVSTPAPYVAETEGDVRVALVDYGAKRSIAPAARARRRGGDRLPARVDPDQLASYDGVLLSNGPGDPAPLVEEIAVVRDSSAACPCSGSASATSCSASQPGTRREAAVRPPRREPSRTRPRVRGACSSRARITGSRSRRPTAARRRTSRSTTAPSRASTSRSSTPRVQFHPEAGPGPARRVAHARRLGRGAAGRVPARRDIHSICLIGSGPIVIGQACEFDYAGCQALKVLREDGYRTIVVNSNPATIMTDPGFADRTYIEPLDLEGVADVLRRERPDALLPTLGRPDGAQPRDRTLARTACSRSSASSSSARAST